MKWSPLLKDYFSFTRKERLAFLIIILITALIYTFPKITKPANDKVVPEDTSWISSAKPLEVKPGGNPTEQENDRNVNELVYDRSATDPGKKLKVQLFYFDPNTLSFEEWQKLGIREKTIETIQKYLSKGGHFYKAEDLKKIYSLKPDEYLRLESYIRIKSRSDNSTEQVKIEHKEQSFNKPKYTLVDINTADTSAFIALPGIGNKLASRIVNFREKLGGFYSVEQIGETYGLPDSTFQKIKPFLKIETNSIKKININTATKDEMKVHPYLKWNLANAIVEYRNQHGNYNSIEDLKNISLITDEVFNKIKFYLTL